MVPTINSNSVDRYAVFGNPIEQSRSPEIHQLFARQNNGLIEYSKILGQKGMFSANLDEFFSDPKAKGCNVTLPFKQDAADWVDELSENAKACGAVNTIHRKENGKYFGDNTDGKGLIHDLKIQDVSFLNAKVLLIGAGGAARGVVLPFLENQVSGIDIVNRTKSKAVDLAAWFNNECIIGLSFDELNESLKTYDIIVNCTSASLTGDLPSVNNQVLAQAKVVYDMVYLANDTMFMQKAKQLGIKTVSDGLGMLVGQAAFSYMLWRGIMPDTKEVLAYLRASL